MKYLPEFIMTLTLIALSVVIIEIAVPQYEKSECLKWQKAATEYKDYYILPFQKIQCDKYKVEINSIILK